MAAVAATPIGPFVRFVIAGASAVYANWDSISSLFQRADTSHTEPRYGYYSQHKFQMQDSTGAWTDREVGMFGVHWINTTGGDLDVTWTTADYTAVETGIQTMWTALGSFISSSCRLVEHRWYAYGPGVIAPNPPSRVTTITPIPGTATAAFFTRQVGSTVTLRTPLRRHWGRIYLPVSSGQVQANGQWTTAACDTLAAAAKTGLTSASSSQGIVPVVWDRARKSALGVTSYEVDSVPDVIRRRRPRTTLYRAILTS